jgi:hypothetical protein
MQAKRFLSGLAALLLTAMGVAAQQASPPIALPPPVNAPSAEFVQAADNVLTEMSKLLSLPILSPLKKSLRSRDEIQAYLVQKMKEDKDPGKRYADQKALEKFGLLPKDYPLEAKLMSILTEQIAGLYDPDSKEFFIADWTTPADEETVMAHELTHALMDQHFHIDQWSDAAKPNDDAELARDAVIEGSAVAAMVDYQFRGIGSVRDIPAFDPAELMGDPSTSDSLSDAPKVIVDELLFPYTAGAVFTQSVLKATAGWPDFHTVFEKPPASTHQIMHPDLYLEGIVSPKIALPETKGVLSADWKKLDENTLGEFGVLEVLKEAVEKQRAASLAAEWSADRYAIFENQTDKRTLLLLRIRLGSEIGAAQFFGAYSEVLDQKYASRENLVRRPNFYSFDTPEGGVFLRCLGTDCLIFEGETRESFDRITKGLNWPANPAVPTRPDAKKVNVAMIPVGGIAPTEGRQPTQPIAP